MLTYTEVCWLATSVLTTSTCLLDWRLTCCFGVVAPQVYVVKSIYELGYHVLHTDADVTWWRDPMPWVDKVHFCDAFATTLHGP
jgi:hypothetical protein